MALATPARHGEHMRLLAAASIASILGLLLLTGCPRGNWVSVGPDTYLPTSTEPYSVDKVAIGSSIAAVRSALGEPAKVVGSPGYESWEFEPAPIVVFRKDAVRQVQGESLLRGDAVLVRKGASEAEVVAALGVGWVQEQWQPTQAGGGMITTGSRFVGKEYRYRDGDVTFHLWVREGALQSVRGELGWSGHHREPTRPR